MPALPALEHQAPMFSDMAGVAPYGGTNLRRGLGGL
jgi:hypothetical protein